MVSDRVVIILLNKFTIRVFISVDLCYHKVGHSFGVCYFA